MTEPKPMTEEEVCAAVDAELNTSRILRDGKVGTERTLAYEYYFGLPFGNEETGRSQMVSQLVMEVVDSLMPDLMKVFTSGEKAVEFMARKAEDVELAEQATEVCNYVLYTQNDGFRLQYEAIKDALLLKTGIFKYWWAEEKKIVEETFQGLSEGQILLLAQDKQVEIVAASPSDAMMVPIPQEMQAPGPPGQPPMQQGPAGPPGPMVGEGGRPIPEMAPQTFDVTVRRSKKSGHICIETLPPEELLVSSRARSIDVQDLPFVAHETKKTLSDLVEMGVCDAKEALDLPSGESSAHFTNDLAIERETRTEGMTLDATTSSMDPMLRVVTYVEAYQYLDVDGDGISELRKICKVNTAVLINEPTERIPFAILTPKIMPHEFYGVSLADDSMDLQLLKSTLWRMQLDGLYHALYPRQVVVESMVSPNTYADLLAPGPNRPIRVKAAGAVTPMVSTYTGDSAMNMMEFIEQEVEGRTPVNRQYQGLPDNAINKTATSATIVSSRSQARTELIARIFAETGFKELFRGILWLLGKYQQEPMIVRISNDYKPIDPRAWQNEYDMTCNVGLGLGSKGEQLQLMQAITMAQQAAVQAGGMGLLVTPKNIYNAQAKVAQLSGFKDPNVFWTKPPDQYQPPPPQPPPQVLVEQIKQQGEQAKFQATQAADAQKFQAEQQGKAQQLAMEAQAKDREQQNALALQQSNDQRQAQLDAMAHQREMERMDREFAFKEREMMVNAQLKREEMAMKAEAQIKAAAMRPQPQPRAN